MSLTTTDLIVYGTSWCYDCRRTRKYLDQHNVAYRWVDIDLDVNGRAFVEKVNHGMRSVPTLAFADGNLLVEPSERELASCLGISPSAN